MYFEEFLAGYMAGVDSYGPQVGMSTERRTAQISLARGNCAGFLLHPAADSVRTVVASDPVMAKVLGRAFLASRQGGSLSLRTAEHNRAHDYAGILGPCPSVAIAGRQRILTRSAKMALGAGPA